MYPKSCFRTIGSTRLTVLYWIITFWLIGLSKPYINSKTIEISGRNKLICEDNFVHLRIRLLFEIFALDQSGTDIQTWPTSDGSSNGFYSLSYRLYNIGFSYLNYTRKKKERKTRSGFVYF